jgi:hypothetical protein
MLSSNEQEKPKSSPKGWVMFRKAVRVILLIWLAVFSITVGPAILRFSLQRMYTPPALTPHKLDAYRDFVSFVRCHETDRDVTLSRWGDVGFGLSYLSLNDANSCSLFQGQYEVSATEVAQLKQLVKRFRRVGCQVAWKRGQVVLFIQHRNRIFPTSPGVLYSLNGEDPNQINDSKVALRKPFVPIAGQWYLSRRLVCPDRARAPETVTALPNSWLDRSLCVKNVHPNDLTAENTSRDDNQ